MKRSLTLHRETLADLTNADLGAVVGGAMSGPTCPALDCLSDFCNLTVQPRCV